LHSSANNRRRRPATSAPSTGKRPTTRTNADMSPIFDPFFSRIDNVPARNDPGRGVPATLTGIGELYWGFTN
jgi:hypothetical protein